MWSFKGYFWSSPLNILPYIERYYFSYNVQILRALGFKSSYAFLKRLQLRLATKNFMLFLTEYLYGLGGHIDRDNAWWRHQMETFSALLAICARNSPVPGEFPAQRPVTRSFDVFFDLHLNKRLSWQSRGWWFETLSCPLWHQCNGNRLLLIRVLFVISTYRW